MLDACDLLPSLSFGTIRTNRLRERTRPWLIQAADFDGDGRPDVAFVDAEGGFDRPARTLIVLAGRDGGAGSELRFEPLARLELDFLPTQMLAADLDGDGLSDLAFLAAARVRVLLNVGGGQLAEGGEFRLDTGRPTTPLIASDLDLDGDLDLLTASRSTGRVLVLRNDGRGNFPARPALLEAGETPLSVAAEDVDGDGLPDLAVANRGSDDVSLFRSLGGGEFAAPVSLALEPGSGPLAVHAADLDGDGDRDLLTVNRARTVSVFLGDGAGGFAAARDQQVAGAVWFQGESAVGDLTGDGLPDVVVVDHSTRRLLFLANDGNEGFEEAVDLPLDEGFTIDVADFDGDGVVDVAAAGRSSLSIVILRGDPGGGSPAVQRVRVGGRPSALLVADLDQDGILDAAAAADDSAEIHWLPGGRRFRRNLDVVAGGQPAVALIGADVNGDGLPDLVTANQAADTLSLVVNLGGGEFVEATQLATFPRGSRPRDVVAGDADGDGDVDLVAALEGSREVAVLENDGVGGFSQVTRFPAGAAPTSLALVDLDKDGVLDLASADRELGRLRVFLGLGDASFRETEDLAVGEHPVKVATGDLDGDGDVDLVVANEGSGDLALLVNDGSGALSVDKRLTAGSGATFVHVLDIDGDGHLDLVSLDRVNDEIRLFLNQGGAEFPEPPLALERGRELLFPVAVESGDLDRDGDRDLVILGRSVSFGVYDVVFTIANELVPEFGPDIDGNGVLDACESYFNRADADASGFSEITDSIFLLLWLFLGGEKSPCLDAADANNDGSIDISDPIIILNNLFISGAGLPPPRAYNPCGPDPEGGDLGCEVFDACQGIDFGG